MTVTNQDVARAREWWDNNAPLYSPADALAEYAAHVTAEKDAEVARLRAALTAAEERAAETLALLNAEIAKNQWQPIEDAPKDGSPVFVFNKIGEYGAMRYAEFRHKEDIDYWWRWCSLAADQTEPFPIQPTHYMPLPAAPCTEDK